MSRKLFHFLLCTSFPPHFLFEQTAQIEEKMLLIFLSWHMLSPSASQTKWETGLFGIWGRCIQSYWSRLSYHIHSFSSSTLGHKVYISLSEKDLQNCCSVNVCFGFFCPFGCADFIWHSELEEEDESPCGSDWHISLYGSWWTWGWV